jgi:hypothetical protein
LRFTISESPSIFLPRVNSYIANRKFSKEVVRHLHVAQVKFRAPQRCTAEAAKPLNGIGSPAFLWCGHLFTLFKSSLPVLETGDTRDFVWKKLCAKTPNV